MILIFRFSVLFFIDEQQWASCYSLERQFRYILFVQLMHQFKFKYYCQAAKSLRMLWRALPACYLDKQEMTLILFHYSSGPDFVEFQGQIKDMWAWYESVLGAEPDFKPRQPRSLQHLCRCSVRTALYRNFALPAGVEQLLLPSILKSYLWLEH